MPIAEFKDLNHYGLLFFMTVLRKQIQMKHCILKSSKSPNFEVWYHNKVTNNTQIDIIRMIHKHCRFIEISISS